MMVADSTSRRRRAAMIRQRIRDALAAKGIAQKELAAAVGVAPQTICDYLAGRRNLPYETLEKVFAHLGL